MSAKDNEKTKHEGRKTTDKRTRQTENDKEKRASIPGIKSPKCRPRGDAQERIEVSPDSLPAVPLRCFSRLHNGHQEKKHQKGNHSPQVPVRLTMKSRICVPQRKEQMLENIVFHHSGNKKRTPRKLTAHSLCLLCLLCPCADRTVSQCHLVSVMCHAILKTRPRRIAFASSLSLCTLQADCQAA